MCDGFSIGEAGTRSVGTNYSYDSNPNKSEEPKKKNPIDISVFAGYLNSLGGVNNEASGIMNG